MSPCLGQGASQLLFYESKWEKHLFLFNCKIKALKWIWILAPSLGGSLGIAPLTRDYYLGANLTQAKLRNKIPRNRSEKQAIHLLGKMG